MADRESFLVWQPVERLQRLFPYLALSGPRAHLTRDMAGRGGWFLRGMPPGQDAIAVEVHIWRAPGAFRWTVHLVWPPRPASAGLAGGVGDATPECCQSLRYESRAADAPALVLYNVMRAIRLFQDKVLNGRDETLPLWSNLSDPAKALDECAACRCCSPQGPASREGPAFGGGDAGAGPAKGGLWWTMPCRCLGVCRACRDAYFAEGADVTVYCPLCEKRLERLEPEVGVSPWVVFYERGE